ncbi:hypothetical protein D3C85_1642110 [compost metagenome]
MKSSVLWRADVWLNGLKLRTQVVAGSILTVSTDCAMAGAAKRVNAVGAQRMDLFMSAPPLFGEQRLVRRRERS